MSDPLVTLRIHAPAGQYAALGTLLDAAGALAHTAQDAADDPLLEPPPGAMPLWPQVVVTAWFPAALKLTALRGLLRANGLRVGRPRAVRERDWVSATQRVTALRYGRAAGRHVWVAPPGSTQVPPGAPVVWLTPGLGFGTGTHPTTALCLRALAGMDLRGARVLDFGCGSGILALAAARLGARSVRAVDNDPQARTATAQNVAANDLAGTVRVGEPGSARGAFDVVVANIILPVLMALMPRLRAHLAPGGRLLLSGVLTAQVPDLQAACAPWLADAVVRRRAGWALLAGVRRDA